MSTGRGLLQIFIIRLWCFMGGGCSWAPAFLSDGCLMAKCGGGGQLYLAFIVCDGARAYSSCLISACWVQAQCVPLLLICQAYGRHAVYTRYTARYVRLVMPAYIISIIHHAANVGIFFETCKKFCKVLVCISSSPHQRMPPCSCRLCRPVSAVWICPIALFVVHGLSVMHAAFLLTGGTDLTSADARIQASSLSRP